MEADHKIEWSIGRIIDAPIGTCIVMTEDGWRTAEGELLPSGTTAEIERLRRGHWSYVPAPAASAEAGDTDEG